MLRYISTVVVTVGTNVQYADHKIYKFNIPNVMSTLCYDYSKWTYAWNRNINYRIY